jgi:hypothetical protein
MRKSLFIILFFSVFLTARSNDSWKEKTENANYIHRAIKQVTDVMVHDIYSPPVASRTYAYLSIGAYEAMAAGDPSYRSFAGQLKDLKPLPRPEPGLEYSYTIAAVHTVLAIGKALVISEQNIDNFLKTISEELKQSGIPATTFDNSVAFGQRIAKHILDWASQDQYKQTRTFTKYAVTDVPAYWKPTPPAYMRAVEPHWNKMRTFILDSAGQFPPLPPTAFSGEKDSPFYNEAKAVHAIGSQLTQEQKDIANFWDCNPYKMNVSGHVMYASKKISPGGHWMNINRLACQKLNASPMQAAETYACLAITIADAFISCWDEKYRSLVIRPETYINKHIDGSWMPLLQTPPFPEYTSGHSVISAAASIMMTHMFGDNFSYADSTEVEFGIPVRHFTSFAQAAEEAAISRFYGGIHYMPSIDNGFEEGKKIGTFVLGRLRTRKQ